MEQQDRDHARHLANQGDDSVVFMVRRDTACGQCGRELSGGCMLMIRQDKALCMACAGLGDLVLLPAGDPAVTRRATKLSPRHAVVVRWARARKRYERRGVLVEESAIAAAQAQCAADAEARARKSDRAAIKRQAEDKAYQQAFLAELMRLFPGCPAPEAADITRHACEKYSGRVGRSAAAKELDEEMIRLAVIAHIRHIHTGYDDLIDMTGKQEARRLIGAKIERVLEQWRGAGA